MSTIPLGQSAQVPEEAFKKLPAEQAILVFIRTGELTSTASVFPWNMTSR